MNAVTAVTGSSFLEVGEPKSKVEVSFRKNMTRPQLWEAIGKYENPQVIFFYIGVNGFRQAGMRYYQEDLRTIVQLGNASSCWLYDMSAWAGLRSKQVSIESENPNCGRINQFGIKGIRAIASSDFFRWIKDLKTSETADYLKTVVLNRNWIYRMSEEMQDYGRTVGEVFENNCPSLEPLYSKDSAKCYSALQYIEGFFFIDQIVNAALASSKREADVVLALPNNEWEYYLDVDSSFEEDVRMLLKLKGVEDFRLNVEFCCFKFGKKPSFRPYNALGDRVQEMQPEDLI